jgi:hypothetical protein
MKKKPKKYAEGGLAGIAENAESLMGEVDGMADTINYGSSTSTGGSQPLGLQAVSGFKKGGTVKSSASKRADGIALRGKLVERWREMRLKRKPNPSRSIPSRSAPSFSPKMPMVPRVHLCEALWVAKDRPVSLLHVLNLICQ